MLRRDDHDISWLELTEKVAEIDRIAEALHTCLVQNFK